jgi:hypothetical protein
MDIKHITHKHRRRRRVAREDKRRNKKIIIKQKGNHGLFDPLARKPKRIRS